MLMSAILNEVCKWITGTAWTPYQAIRCALGKHTTSWPDYAGFQNVFLYYAWKTDVDDVEIMYLRSFQTRNKKTCLIA